MVNLLLKGSPAHFEKLVPEIADQMRRGELVFVVNSLSGGCSYECIKCFANTYDAQLAAMGQTSPFTLDRGLQRNLLEEAHQLGGRTVIVPGVGEPMETPDLENIVDICSTLDMNLIFFTNGKLFDKETAMGYFDKGVSVIFSLDATTEKNYDILTGTTGNYPIVRQNLIDALDIVEARKQVAGDYHVVQLAINTSITLLTYNQGEGVDEIKEMTQLVGGRVPHFISHPSCDGNAARNWAKLTGMPEGEVNSTLIEGALKYAAETGVSSRRLDDFCSYLHNGVANYAGFWMMCPNVGPGEDLGRFPETPVEEHFSAKRATLSGGLPTKCWARRE